MNISLKIILDTNIQFIIIVDIVDIDLVVQKSILIVILIISKEFFQLSY